MSDTCDLKKSDDDQIAVAYFDLFKLNRTLFKILSDKFKLFIPSFEFINDMNSGICSILIFIFVT